MDSEFAVALDAWNVYFATIAGISATLVGLLFVAIGLNPRIMANDGSTGLRVWAAFTFHSFVVLLVIGIVGLVPVSARETLAVTLAIVGVQGVLRVLTDVRRVRADPDRTWSGWHSLLRFASPGVAYVLCLWIAFGVANNDPDQLGWLVGVTFFLLSSALASCWELLKVIGDQQFA
jgi:hypothetical protein